MFMRKLACVVVLATTTAALGGLGWNELSPSDNDAAGAVSAVARNADSPVPVTKVHRYLYNKRGDGTGFLF
jgi:hypothetical protein